MAFDHDVDFASFRAIPPPQSATSAMRLPTPMRKARPRPRHEISTLPVAERDFPLLRSKEDWDNGPAPAAIVSAQEAIRWAQHLLIVHPLWIGAAPALLKGRLGPDLQ